MHPHRLHEEERDVVGQDGQHVDHVHRALDELPLLRRASESESRRHFTSNAVADLDWDSMARRFYAPFVVFTRLS